jgi:hypothetical protein
MATQVTPEQQKKLEQAFSNFDASPAAATAQAEAVAAAAPINVFCKEWPKVKSVLQFLLGIPVLPQKVKDAIRMVMAAGDTAARVLCH